MSTDYPQYDYTRGSADAEGLRDVGVTRSSSSSPAISAPQLEIITTTTTAMGCPVVS